MPFNDFLSPSTEMPSLDSVLGTPNSTVDARHEMVEQTFASNFMIVKEIQIDTFWKKFDIVSRVLKVSYCKP